MDGRGPHGHRGVAGRGPGDHDEVRGGALPDARATPDDDARLAASERAHVERVLRQTDFHVSAAARLLGISRSKLYDRVHLWGLDLAAMRAASV